MKPFLIAAALVACSLTTTAQATAAARGTVGTVGMGSHAGLSPFGDFTITFLIPGGQPDIITVTRTDGRWRVVSEPLEGREDQCRWREDARRVITGRPVTQGVPRWCMSERDRRLRPDPDPAR